MNKRLFLTLIAGALGGMVSLGTYQFFYNGNKKQVKGFQTGSNYALPVSYS